VEQFDPGLAQRKALWETIVESLRRAIVLGELPAGLRLEEPVLAQKFGVSRIPIREALVRLELEGLVSSEPRRGASIVGFSEDDAHDVYELRRFVESTAARRLADRADQPAVDHLRALTDQMDEAIRRGEPQAMVDPDVEFHRKIVDLAGSRQLSAAWGRLAGLIAAILGITDTTFRDMPGAVRGHAAIVDALARRDGEGAAEEIHRHLENGERVMREAMRAARTDGVTPTSRAS
jgi:GntR family transcriptional regulator of gluconate operon